MTTPYTLPRPVSYVRGSESEFTKSGQNQIIAFFF